MLWIEIVRRSWLRDTLHDQVRCDPMFDRRTRKTGFAISDDASSYTALDAHPRQPCCCWCTGPVREARGVVPVRVLDHRASRRLVVASPSPSRRCALMGTAGFSTTVLPLTVTPPLDASATSASLPPAGVAFTVNTDLSGTEEVFSASL